MSSASNRYKVELSDVAKKDLAGLDGQIQRRVRLAFSVLGKNPRPPLAKKLKGQKGYRVRVGNYRIIYKIFDEKILVLVVRIGHRRDIYKYD